jgi:hypothetical protein
VVKPLADYYRNAKMRDGHFNSCKECELAKASAYREANRERQRAYAFRNNPRVGFDLLRLDGSQYGLATQYIRALRQDPCAYCGDPGEDLDHIFPLWRTRPRGGISVDEWAEVTNACRKCNMAKRTQTLLEFLGWPSGWLRRPAHVDTVQLRKVA